MQTQPLDELYFVWLTDFVGGPAGKPDRKYLKLLRQLLTKEFVWVIPNDDNRAEDGKALRDLFLAQEGISDVDSYWANMGCSMFELLVGLSRRLSFETDGFDQYREPSGWFWVLVRNLGLANSRITKSEIDRKLDVFIWRTYEPNGRGGLFPLLKAHQDQRKVEIWYQMCAYVLEMDE
jgi:hypothetical protein